MKINLTEPWSMIQCYYSLQVKYDSEKVSCPSEEIQFLYEKAWDSVFCMFGSKQKDNVHLALREGQQPVPQSLPVTMICNFCLIKNF